MTLQEIINEKQQQYNAMRMLWLRGKITTESWCAFCDGFLFQILESEDIRSMFERMKNGDNR